MIEVKYLVADGFFPHGGILIFISFPGESFPVSCVLLPELDRQFGSVNGVFTPSRGVTLSGQTGLARHLGQLSRGPLYSRFQRLLPGLVELHRFAQLRNATLIKRFNGETVILPHVQRAQLERGALIGEDLVRLVPR